MLVKCGEVCVLCICLRLCCESSAIYCVCSVCFDQLYDLRKYVLSLPSSIRKLKYGVMYDRVVFICDGHVIVTFIDDCAAVC